jgi:cyclic pyranopterin phosphate synthase
MNTSRSKKLTHVDVSGNPRMVNVSDKKITKRVAEASAEVWLGREIVSHLTGQEILTKKGPVFQTAVLAGVMGAKKTSELIPFCHPLAIEDCDVQITLIGETAHIYTKVVTTGKTGVEMEALTAASIAALTIFDMCKALSSQMVIGEVAVVSKSGGKSDFKRKKKI